MTPLRKLSASDKLYGCGKPLRKLKTTAASLPASDRAGASDKAYRRIMSRSVSKSKVPGSGLGGEGETRISSSFNVRVVIVAND